MHTDKKNQHYIPKFYLRNFSCQGNSNQIGIFNLESSFYFQTSKLKSQGSKNFFYGYDGKIEDSLSDIEGLLSVTIRNILSTWLVPKKGGAEHFELLAFVALTHLRNPVMIEHVKNTQEAIKNHLLELDPLTDTNRLAPGISHNEAIELSLSALGDIIASIADLEYKLIKNKTNRPFISSDFPVVKYNRFLEMKKYMHGKTGYGTIGLQIFIPLNPETIIAFYDPLVYKIGFRKRSVLEITNESDINKLNTLQVLNCFETLFFNEKASEHYIRDLVTKSAKYKRANQTRSELSYLLDEEDNLGNLNDKKKNLIVLGITDCEINLEITGIKFHSGSKKIKLDNSVAQLRPNPKKLMNNSR